MNTMHKKNDHPAYLFRRDPWSLISRVGPFLSHSYNRTNVTKCQGPINSIIKFTVGKEYLCEKAKLK